MVKYHAVCKSGSQNKPNLSYFHFPSDQKLRKKWGTFCRRADEKLTTLADPGICSQHFSREYRGPMVTELPAKRQRADVPEGKIGIMHSSSETGSTAENTGVISDHDYTDRFENFDEQHRNVLCQTELRQNGKGNKSVFSFNPSLQPRS